MEALVATAVKALPSETSIAARDAPVHSVLGLQVASIINNGNSHRHLELYRTRFGRSQYSHCLLQCDRHPCDLFSSSGLAPGRLIVVTVAESAFC